MNNPDERLTTEDLARRAEYDAPPSDERVANRAEAERRPAAEDRAIVADAPHASGAEPRDRAREMAREERTDRDVQLFEQEEMSRMRSRWSDIQAGFVDEPRKAVELADSLVAETMQRLAQMFAEARHDLERQWDRGEDVTTEDLRLALQRYRSFFDRLLSM